jgi:hypothetical protein
MSMRSNHSHLAMQNRSRQSGLALSLTLHCVLLLLVLGQVVYLATRHRARIDATSDQLYSLTESTLRIVGGLEKRLVVEAYFSPKEELPADLRNTRVVLDNFLDELIQIGKGKVVVKRFNPIEDKALQDTCTRIGIKPIDTQSSTTTAVGVSRAYKSTRTREIALLPRDVLWMSVQIVLAMVGIAVFLYLLVIVLLPRLPVE